MIRDVISVAVMVAQGGVCSGLIGGLLALHHNAIALRARVAELEYQLADFRRRPGEPLTDGRTLARFNLDMLRRGLGQ